MHEKPITLALLISGLLACASGPNVAPQEQDTLSSVRAAEELGAESEPPASLHLKMARDGVAEAEKLMKDGEDEKALRAYERAESDAELAIALVKQEQAKRHFDSAQEELDEARQMPNPPAASSARTTTAPPQTH